MKPVLAPIITTALPFGTLMALNSPAAAQATRCRDSFAISENSRMGGYSGAELRQHMVAACRPGDLLRLNGQHADNFCDFNKQIVQEGRGIVACVMASAPAQQR
jgi:hypothetical protein